MPDIALAEAALRQSSSGISRRPSVNQDRARSAENRISRASEPSGSASRPLVERSRTPNRSRSSAGTYTRPLSRSSRRSRRMLACCRAMPSASAYRARPGPAGSRTRPGTAGRPRRPRTGSTSPARRRSGSAGRSRPSGRRRSARRTRPSGSAAGWPRRRPRPAPGRPPAGRAGLISSRSRSSSSARCAGRAPVAVGDVVDPPGQRVHRRERVPACTPAAA